MKILWVSVLAVLQFACGGGSGSNSGGQGQAVTATTKVVDQNGGTLSLDGMALTIPAGALQGPISITVRKQTIANAPEIIDGVLYEFTPDGLQFDLPVTLSMPMPDNSLLGPGEEFRIAKYRVTPDYDDPNQNLSYLIVYDTTVDATTQLVSTEISGFSSYGTTTSTTFPPILPPVPNTTASYDSCNRRLTLTIRGSGVETATVTAFIQQRSRQARPLGSIPPWTNWSTDWAGERVQQPQGSLVFSALPRPAAGESAYTYEYQVGTRLCETLQCNPPRFHVTGTTSVLALERPTPGRIENLAITATTSNSRSLDWDHAILPEEHYDYFEVMRRPPWSGPTGGDWLNIGVSPSWSYRDTQDIQPNTNYTYFVRAVNATQPSCPNPLAGAAASTSSSSIPPASITRVSVDSAGVEGNQASGGPGEVVAISADGRYVAFSSDASNLVAGDSNGRTDVFLHDTQTGTTTRVSVDSAGGEGNQVSIAPSISADGRYIAFMSAADNLVAGDSNVGWDVFLHDTQTGATTRISVDSAGGEGNGDSMLPSISADGRFIAFMSVATNLVGGDTNGFTDIFLHDTQTGATTRVSVDAAGVESNDHSNRPALNEDGRYIAFTSEATNLVAGDGNGRTDIFLHDTQTGATTRVSVDSSGNEANGSSGRYRPAISADGRYIAFVSGATNLVTGDSNGRRDVFLHDTQTGTTRVSVDSAGVEANFGSDNGPAISADGRYIAFSSGATNLVAGDTNGFTDIFLHDTQTGATNRVSVDAAGVESNGHSSYLAISADGSYVAFQSDASNLVANDTNGRRDVFRAPRQ